MWVCVCVVGVGSLDMNEVGRSQLSNDVGTRLANRDLKMIKIFPGKSNVFYSNTSWTFMGQQTI